VHEQPDRIAVVRCGEVGIVTLGEQVCQLHPSVSEAGRMTYAGPVIGRGKKDGVSNVGVKPATMSGVGLFWQVVKITQRSRMRSCKTA
jgi:hypothetical protein